MTTEVTPDTTNTIGSRAELDAAIAELAEVSAALDGEVGGEFANGALAWLVAVEKVQRMTRTWDSIKDPNAQLAEALHARLQGVTDVLAQHATSSQRPRTFSDFAKRATVRALKAVDATEGKAG